MTFALASLARRFADRRPDWWARKEPHLEPGRARRSMIPEMRRVILSEWQQRRNSWIVYIAIISFVAHLILIFGVIYFAGREEEEAPPEPIPVNLVMLPPQDPARPKPPPPPPQPQQKQKPPPPGPLASDELGDPNATGKVPASTHTPEAGKPVQHAGEAPPPSSQSTESEHPSDVARPKPDQAEQQSAAPDQERLPDTPEKLAIGGALAPPPTDETKPRTEQLAAKPVDRPNEVKLLRVKPGGATKPTDRPDDADHSSGHKAKYPGPDASYDEYLAYIRDLTVQQINRIPVSVYNDIRRPPMYVVLIRPNGSIMWFTSTQPSGSAEADRAISDALHALSDFPPLPARLLQPDGKPTRLELMLPTRLGTNP